MPRSSGKKRTGTPPAPPDDATACPPLNPLRTGMPAQDSITGVKQLKRGSKVYRIIKTSEMDSYDKPALPKGRRKRRQ